VCVSIRQVDGQRANVVTRDFFLEPEPERLPDRYADDRVLIFARDAATVYTAWDFANASLLPAQGQVVDARGVAHASFPVEAASGGRFVTQLPAGVPLRVEIHQQSVPVGLGAWVVLEGVPSAAASSSAV
jgi:hypothetical protein